MSLNLITMLINMNTFQLWRKIFLKKFLDIFKTLLYKIRVELIDVTKEWHAELFCKP